VCPSTTATTTRIPGLRIARLPAIGLLTLIALHPGEGGESHRAGARTGGGSRLARGQQPRCGGFVADQVQHPHFAMA
jgi:hypothetical protein